MANQFDDIDIFDTSQDVGSIEPIRPEPKGLMDLYLDYLQQDPLAQQVSGGDPLKKGLRFVSEFIPGVSTELARREGDKLGEALSYLDVIPGTQAIPPAVKREAAEQVFKFVSTTDADAIVPLNQIEKVKDQFGRVIKSDEDKVKRAQNLMQSAAEGKPYKGVSIDKRQPIEVIRMPDGSLQQIGGKSTREALEAFGETEVPVRIFNNVDEFEAYDAARKASKERKRVDKAYQLQPTKGDPTFEKPLEELGDAKLENMTVQVFKEPQFALKTADQLYGQARKVNDQFQSKVAGIANDMNLEKAPKYKYDEELDKVVDVEIKTLDSINKKINKKGYPASEVTDGMRTRIYVNTAEEANEVARRIANEFPTIDSGNQVYKSSGFSDRKLNVQFIGDDGQPIIAEIGIIHKAMAEAADEGHKLYKQLDAIDAQYPAGSEIPFDVIQQKEAIAQKQLDIYTNARNQIDPEFFKDAIIIEKRFGGYIGKAGSSSPTDPNFWVNSDFDSLEPFSYQSVTVAPLAGRQSLSDGFIKKPLKAASDEGTRTAGPFSQEKYKVSTEDSIQDKAKNIHKPLTGGRKLI